MAAGSTIVRQVRGLANAAILASTVLGPAAIGAEAPYEDPAARAPVLDAIFAEYSDERSPGIALGVLWNGHSFARGYGYADLEHDVPVTPDTVFHVASVSKQFTAFCAALLAAEGRVDLDGDLRSILPELSGFDSATDAAITPRHLILHTSGLRDQWTLFVLGGMEMDNRLRQRQILRMVERQQALNFPPGTNFAYSNTGYTLLAELVARRSGRSFAEFADARIFQPLGMTNTFFYDDVTELVDGRAESYESGEDGRWRRSLLNFDNAGATSLHTTAPDLLKWARNFLAPSVGAGSALDSLMRMGALDDGTPIDYGFGLQSREIAGHRALWHSGSDAGFRSILSVFPDEGLAVVILANSPVNLMAPLLSVASLYLQDDAEAWREALPAATPGTPKLDGLLGHYSAPNRPAIRLLERGGRVVAGIAGDDTGPVTFRADGSFDFGDEERIRGTHYHPVFEEGRVTALEERGAAVVQGRRTVYRKFKPRQPFAAELAALAGDYRSPELDITWSLSVEDGELYIESLWSERLHLEPLTANRFGGKWPMHDVRIERDSRGRPVALVVSSERARNVRLVRQD